MHSYDLYHIHIMSYQKHFVHRKSFGSAFLIRDSLDCDSDSLQDTKCPPFNLRGLIKLCVCVCVCVRARESVCVCMCVCVCVCVCVCLMSYNGGRRYKWN